MVQVQAKLQTRDLENWGQSSIFGPCHPADSATIHGKHPESTIQQALDAVLAGFRVDCTRLPVSMLYLEQPGKG
jgi:hypothetical protein